LATGLGYTEKIRKEWVTGNTLRRGARKSAGHLQQADIERAAKLAAGTPVSPRSICCFHFSKHLQLGLQQRWQKSLQGRKKLKKKILVCIPPPPSPRSRRQPVS